MKSSLIVVIFCLYVAMSDSQTTKMPSSWNHCTCLASPAMATATDECKTEMEKTPGKMCDCILKKLKVYDGSDDSKPDVTVAKSLIDAYNATSGQKESLKKSLDSCDAQSKNRAKDFRNCVCEISRRRCAMKPCPPKE